MNIAAYGHKFFLFGGAILIAVAILQVLIRPRPKNKASDVETLEGLAAHSAPATPSDSPALPPSGTSGPTPPTPTPLATLASARAVSPRPPAMVRGRPSRPASHAPGLRFLDATIIKAVLFVAVGILAILVGTGTIPMAGGR
jgi:hypothetical protein